MIPLILYPNEGELAPPAHTDSTTIQHLTRHVNDNMVLIDEAPCGR